jgi:N-acetylneuraminic acid mutarotase
MKDLRLVTSGAQLYLLGGYNIKWFNWVYQYNEYSGWDDVTTAHLSSDRSNFAAVSGNDTMYAIGGLQYTGAISAVEMFIPAQGLCAPFAPLTYPRDGAAAAFCNGSLYVFGGESGNLVVPAYEKYDFTQKSWRSVTTMPIPRYNLAAATVDGAIYLIGGIDGSGRSVGAVEVYSP